MALLFAQWETPVMNKTIRGMMRRIYRDTLRIIKLNMGNILLFEILYRFLMLPLSLWFANWAVRAALQLSGYSYVTVGNLASFLVHPGTILLLFVSVLFMVVLMALEASCLVEAFQASACGRREGALRILIGGCLRFWGQMKRRNVGLFLVLFIHGLMVNGFMILQLFRQIKPLNFVLDGIGGEPAVQWGLAVFFAVLAAVSIPSAYMAFACMVEQRSFKNGISRSWGLCGKQPVKAVSMLISVNVLAVLAALLVFVLMVVIAAVFAVVFVDRNLELVLLLKLKRNLVLAAVLVGGAFCMMGNYGALTVLYYRRIRQEGDGVWEFAFPTGRLLRRSYLLGSLALVTAFCMTLAWDAFHNGLSLDDEGWSEIRVTAHRGSSKDAPENTMAALELAVEQLADSVEIDVQETKDGVLVLFHDANLRRIAGRGGRIRDYEYEELSKLDVGSWFSPEYAGERIPTFSEAVNLCKGRIFMNIELKGVENGSDLPERMAALIEEFDILEQSVVTSTNLEYLRRVKEVNPEIRTGYIVSAAYGSYYKEDAMDFVSMLSSSLDRRLVDSIHEEGKAVHAWTVNSKTELRRMKRLGVDNVITDYPIYAREVLYETESGTEFLEKLLLMLR